MDNGQSDTMIGGWKLIKELIDRIGTDSETNQRTIINWNPFRQQTADSLGLENKARLECEWISFGTISPMMMRLLFVAKIYYYDSFNSPFGVACGHHQLIDSQRK